MKTILKFALMLCLGLACINVKAQVSELTNTSGNSTDFLGWDDNTTFDLLVKHEGTFGIQFWSDDQLRMILQANGALNYGSNTIDEPSSVGIGNSNVITNLSDHSMAVGSVNVIDTCMYCFAAGIGNFAGGATSGDEGCISLGDNNDALGHDTFAAGEGNLTNGQATVALGHTNQVTGVGSVALGRQNLIGTTTGVLATSSCLGSAALGCLNTVLSDLSGAYGANNDIPDGYDYSYTLGARLRSNATNSVTIGRGLDANLLLNDVNNSMMVGFNSDSPTLIVTGGNGAVGTYGEVGIGIDFDPNFRLQQNSPASSTNYHQFTIESTTGTSATDGLLIGLSSAGQAVIDLQETGSIIFENGTTGTQEKMRIDLIGNVGIGTNSPQNRIHQNFSGVSQNYHQFTNLNTGSASTDGLRIGIDATGNGIVDMQEGNYLAFETNTAGERLRIEADGDVGIGTTNATSRLTVANSLTSSGSTAYVSSQGTGSIENSGLNVRTLGGKLGITGIYSAASPNSTGDGGTTSVIGLKAEASSVYGNTDYTGYTNVYGIYAESSGAISGTSYYAGYFNGDVYTSGTYDTSDAMLKNNVNDMSNEAASLIQQLNPVTYEFAASDFPSMNLPTGVQAGFLAQDVELILPGLVKSTVQPEIRDEDGNVIYESVTFKAVNYTGLIPYLVEVVQEQQSQISSQQLLLNALQEQINSCCSDLKNSTSGQQIPSQSFSDQAWDIKLSTTLPILYQNTPNPHQGQTLIRYFLPDNSGSAEMHFFDTQGQVIRIEALGQTGMGQINVDASDLANGVYTYALLINGKVIDMKKMVKE